MNSDMDKPPLIPQAPDDELREILKRELHVRKITEDAEMLTDDFAAFVREAWPVLKPEIPYVHNWHIDAICENLAAVSHGEIKRLIINLPPQSMKSLLTSVMWPAWEWTFAPGMSFWTASYSTDLSGRNSAMSLLLMQSQWYQDRWGDRFRFIRDAEHFFVNDRGGLRLATSPTAEMGTGYHGNRILIDDPINVKAGESLSKIKLHDANEWYDSTVSSRGLPGHARVIIMQRIHPEDLTAHVQELEDWDMLVFPEFWEKTPFAYRGDPRSKIPKTQSRRKIKGAENLGDLSGASLWPDYRPPSQAIAAMKGLGYRAAGQYQQRPALKEGELLKANLWRFYNPKLFDEDLSDKRELAAMRKRRPRFTRIVQSIDTPLKDKETNDRISIQAWGVRGADRYLLDIRTDHMNYGKAKRAIIEQARYVRKMYPRISHKILIENAGYGSDLIIDLKRVLTGIEKIPAGQDGDKITRADSASDALESGNCWLPGIGGGPDETLGPAKTASSDIMSFITELKDFPNASYDDQVDAWSQAMNWLRSKVAPAGRTHSVFGRRRRAPAAAA